KNTARTASPLLCPEVPPQLAPATPIAHTQGLGQTWPWPQTSHLASELAEQMVAQNPPGGKEQQLGPSPSALLGCQGASRPAQAFTNTHSATGGAFSRPKLIQDLVFCCGSERSLKTRFSSNKEQVR
uniref:Uncharacterized protein n=1 Tax=Bubo bubo TaxID=30461 RepID=A0A8C0IFT6_BUBBB